MSVSGQPKLHQYFGRQDPHSLATQYRDWTHSAMGPGAYAVALTQGVSAT